MTDYLRIKILLCRSEAQMLFNVLPKCAERDHLKERIAACDFVLEYLKQQHAVAERAKRVD
jgi:hypothetical protein